MAEHPSTWHLDATGRATTQNAEETSPPSSEGPRVFAEPEHPNTWHVSAHSPAHSKDTPEQIPDGPEESQSSTHRAASRPSPGHQLHQVGRLPRPAISNRSHQDDPRGGWGAPPGRALDTSRSRRGGGGRRAASEPSRGADASHRRGPRRDRPRDREDYYSRDPDRGDRYSRDRDRSTSPEESSGEHNSSPPETPKKSRAKGASKTLLGEVRGEPLLRLEASL